MTPEEATRLVESREVFGIRLGLDRMRSVLTELGRPHRRAPAMHVVGTNGKSSTTRLAQAVLTAHGRLTGSYVSPHIADWVERIMIDGRPIGAGAFARAVSRAVDAEAAVATGSNGSLTQFELLTAAAFVAFADAGVDALVVEAGLGGRYDATNVFEGTAAVALTGIAREHTEVLGEDLGDIAAEKLAVCRDGCARLVVGALSATADPAVRSICAARRLRGSFVGQEITIAPGADGITVTTPVGRYPGLRLAAHGGFQWSNAAVAVAGAELLNGGALEPDLVRAALASTVVPGRLEVVAGEPLLVLDGAHNPDGMAALAGALPGAVGARTPVAVVGILADKDVEAMARELARVVDRAIVTRPAGPRAADAGRIRDALRDADVGVEIVASPPDALARARVVAGPGGAVVVCGSLALIADLRTEAVAAWSGGPGILARGKLPEMVDKPER